MADLDESLSGSDSSESEDDDEGNERKETTLSALLKKQAAISSANKEDGEDFPTPALEPGGTFFLNGTYGPKVETFISKELWQPAIQGEFRGGSKSGALLRCPRNAMHEIRHIILGKASHCEELAPNLVHSLTELIKDIGNVSRLFEELPIVDGFM